MAIQLKLDVDQVAAAIMLLDQDERRLLQNRLPVLLGIDQEKLEDLGWLRLAESAFEFWEDPVEDNYDDLVPEASFRRGGKP